MFTNEQDGLNRLSEKAGAILGFKAEKAGAILGFKGETGLEPIEKNFANWIPTVTGLEIHFADYQLGHGLRITTVPRPDLVDLLAPDMIRLTQN
ncbi:RsiV family protein [Mycobacteroides abscessus]|uniref:RsiV family protein n=1 Tax=Mycobacteroides abscessus TaxID=36809 RepID=UPI00078EB389|nr:RsiV family protein [Mycobacteroides abscessus]AMU22170.1 hypothetical protein A3N95_16160 [Mycobacteroides abscessus]SHY80339.1 Uncharacterised protein [Mycobacteroides abscessus subsp. bolletii]SHY98524.1 Uncharacterised protein [Mycobacteroides abscessus subsp. bolletii]SKJ71411.1 Uncharacterised protein [Mycobacteroides abscessus subsp. bolletii]